MVELLPMSKVPPIAMMAAAMPKAYFAFFKKSKWEARIQSAMFNFVWRGFVQPVVEVDSWS